MLGLAEVLLGELAGLRVDVDRLGGGRTQVALEDLVRLAGSQRRVVGREEPPEALARRPKVNVLVAELFLEEILRRCNRFSSSYYAVQSANRETDTLKRI